MRLQPRSYACVLCRMCVYQNTRRRSANDTPRCLLPPVHAARRPVLCRAWERDQSRTSRRVNATATYLQRNCCTDRWLLHGHVGAPYHRDVFGARRRQTACPTVMVADLRGKENTDADTSRCHAHGARSTGCWSSHPGRRGPWTVG